MGSNKNERHEEALSGNFIVAGLLLLEFAVETTKAVWHKVFNSVQQRQAIVTRRQHAYRFVIFLFVCVCLSSSALSLTNNAQSRLHSYVNDVVEPVGMIPLDSSLSARDIKILALNTNGLAEYEGCDTQVYWPGGASGPTIGCGIDLGNIGHDNIDTVFHDLVPRSKIRLMQKACGIRGTAARTWVASHHVVISRDVAQRAFYRTCVLFWKYALIDYPGLEKFDNNTQGVVLSLVFNYGPHARQLDGLRDPIRKHSVSGILEHVRKLQAGVSTPGLVRRRKLECSLLEIVMQNKAPKPPRSQDYFD